MKKLAGLFLAATLTLSMTTVAFAAPSKSTTVSDGTTKEGATVSHVITEDVQKTAGLVKDEKTGKVTLSDEQVSKVEEAIKVSNDAESVDVKVLDVFDVQAPADYVEGNSIDVTLDFPYSEGIQVLHFQDGQWVALPTKEGADGKVVATFTKFSPTAIATVVINKKTEESVTPVTPVTPSDDSTITPSDSTTNNTIAPADNSKTATPAATPASSTTAKADTKTADATKKTGDVNTTVYVALLAAAAGACAIVIRRKMAR